MERIGIPISVWGDTVMNFKQTFPPRHRHALLVAAGSRTSRTALPAILMCRHRRSSVGFISGCAEVSTGFARPVLHSGLLDSHLLPAVPVVLNVAPVTRPTVLLVIRLSFDEIVETQPSLLHVGPEFEGLSVKLNLSLLVACICVANVARSSDSVADGQPLIQTAEPVALVEDVVFEGHIASESTVECIDYIDCAVAEPCSCCQLRRMYSGDALKGIRLGKCGWLDVGGSYRARYHREINIRPGTTGGLSGVDDQFWLHQTRLWFDGGIHPRLKFRVRIHRRGEFRRRISVAKPRSQSP